jgi:hypothetical protein
MNESKIRKGYRKRGNVIFFPPSNFKSKALDLPQPLRKAKAVSETAIQIFLRKIVDIIMKWILVVLLTMRESTISYL